MHWSCVHVSQAGKLWKYQGNVLQKGYPKRHNEQFKGLPANIDTAFTWPNDMKLYFTKGTLLKSRLN